MFNRNGWLVVAVALLVSVPAFAKTLARLESADAHLLVFEHSIEVRSSQRTLVKLTGLSFNHLPLLEWQLAESSTTQIRLNAMVSADAEFYRTAFDTEAQDVQIQISVVDGGFRFFADPQWGNQTTLEFEYLGDHFFGLSAPLQPDNQLSPDLTGKSVNVDVTAEGATFYENYASAFSAFYLSSHGYGGFFDSFASGRYEFAINGKNRIHHNTGTLDWYVFPGATGTEIHTSYYKLIGAPKPVPLWALGPVGWRDQNNGGAQEILEDVARLTEMKIPFTSWFVDRPYSDGAHAWSHMNFSKAFAHPEQWIATLKKDYNLEFMTWVSPATFGDPVFNKHLSGKFSYIDLSDTESVSSYQERLSQLQYNVGVKGHKIDRADEALPVHEPWADGTIHSERRNKYAYLMAKIHHDTLQKHWGNNNVTFARAAIHRTQPYLSAIWGGDPRTTYSGLRANFANAIRSSFMGFPVWGTDVGGYQGDGYIPEDLYARWMQAGSLTGLFEIKLDGAGGSGRDRMPWQYDASFQKSFRAICEDRMAWLPYLYSLANTSATTGVLMKPLAYVHLNDPNTWPLWDQFYFGDAILAAPVFEPAESRRLYLPKGQWRDFDNTAMVYKGGRFIDVPVNLNSLPRFIKQNAIFVTGNFALGNSRNWQTSDGVLTVHVNPGQKTEGTSFLYKDLVDDTFKEIRATRTKKALEITVPAIASKMHLVVYRDRAPKTVTLNNEPVKFDYSKDLARLQLTLQEGSHNRVLIE